MEVTKRCNAKDYATNLGLVPEDDDVPLYTHPAKTLTDEEIKELSEEHLDMDWQTGVIEFARAILKKAQEK